MAHAALASAGPWSVAAVFRRSVYCRAANGSYVCVGPASLGAGPLNLLAALPVDLSWEERGVSPGVAVECDGTELRFDARIGISLASARVWRPALPPPHWDPFVVSSGLEVLEAEVDRWAPMDGLTSAIPGLLKSRPIPPSAPGLTRAMIQVAAPAIAALQAWLESVGTPKATHSVPTPAVETLIGLGPGLTPSGDDLLGGTMIALRTLGWPAAADTLANWLLPRAVVRTHAISCAHLTCAAAGEGASALHDTLAALFSKGCPELPACLHALGAIGHTSGWDVLAGAVLVLRIAAAKASDAACRGTHTLVRCP